MDNNLLSNYLIKRGLNLDPVSVQAKADPVMDDPEMLKGVVEMWGTHQTAITAVLQARINAIAYEILTTCTPEEVIVSRQSLVELGAIITDFISYSSEQEKRDTAEEDTPSKEEESSSEQKSL